MARRENTVPIFTYESEEEDVSYAAAGQGVKRNPYLVDYAAQREMRVGREDAGSGGAMPGRRTQDNDVDILFRRLRPGRGEGNGTPGRPAERCRVPGRARTVEGNGAMGPSRPAERGRVPGRAYAGADNGQGLHGRRPETGKTARTSSRNRPAAARTEPIDWNRFAGRRSPDGSARRLPPAAGGAGRESRRSAAEDRRTAPRRKKHGGMQRLIVVLWAAGILVLAFSVMLRDGGVANAQNKPEDKPPVESTEKSDSVGPGAFVQGIPAEDFARHPEWTENMLTPNEYSRPGDALESVTNIFVHYTANPGTSAAQNRSYFEQQKDTHERSVSSHFIIGYEGEILQCVPLDEIAYAVAGRNDDSISIECCFLASDGSFTQETYDSLIALLAWLVDVYDLDSGDILRHYDCGGKKCPLYYTENPGEWEQLKKDVDKL